MNPEIIKKEEIIDIAKKTTHYCNLLIKQSDSWLSEEEGMKNMERRICDSKKKANRRKNNIFLVPL